MSDVIEHLKSFNRKERFILLNRALGQPNEQMFRLDPCFAEDLRSELALPLEIALHLGCPVPSTALERRDARERAYGVDGAGGSGRRHTGTASAVDCRHDGREPGTAAHARHTEPPGVHAPMRALRTRCAVVPGVRAEAGSSRGRGSSLHRVVRRCRRGRGKGLRTVGRLARHAGRGGRTGNGCDRTAGGGAMHRMDLVGATPWPKALIQSA